MNPSQIFRIIRYVALLLVLLASMNNWVVLGLDRRGLWVVALVVYAVTYALEFSPKRNRRS
ncbi:hypothetical protein [Deinococcus maricopensis]|uniref:Uncharacterized protein n=1 Tax=Deinococcus maricopensis (strain DSM 21211 / LMG 22137 / NRRL B-23946 / LB-34) TaxID=709986 RepID=E8U4I4_DEIML|nr:hypothetical protein [Deinococcus maricopensis]ADV68849.1 hypothetical protein Deima_3222 [Deinococcus maricopensis DSM 21211]